VPDIDSYYQCDRPEMLAFIPTKQKYYLDVGCSSGNFAELIKNRNPQSTVWGIELYREAAKIAEKKIDRVINKTAEMALEDLPDNLFDCVIFNDVLEHLVDPYAFLESIKCKLSKNATIIASIPNMRHYEVLYELLFQKEWRYRDSGGVLDKTHLRFYTISSMQRMFEEAGYQVEKIEGLKGCRKIKIRILSWLTFGFLEDIRFPQVAVLAKKIVQ
jgi:2-polyprenyl-3-methyl-5-hydroxy-6-metoxy-1,4-benzoquinol methylase